jgi:tetratricopeptide (TPR) repeat protein
MGNTKMHGIYTKALRLISLAWGLLLCAAVMAACSVKFNNSRVTSLDIEARNFCREGQRYARLNQADEAIRAYTRSIDIDPSASAYNGRCVEYNRTGRFDMAIADANKAILISPRYAPPYFNRGNALFKKGDYEGAIKDYTRAVTIDPGQAEFYYNLGLAAFKLGRSDEAMGWYEKALAADRHYFAAYYNLACLYAGKKDTVKALDNLEKAVAEGFRDAARMTAEPALETIRNSGRFRGLVKKAGGAAAGSQ